MFTIEFMSLTQLGEVFGVSNQQVGKWLIALGLRTNANKPSREAFSEGFVREMPSRNQGYFWAWHAEKTIAAIEAAGHLRVLNPPPELVQPPTLNGPFSVRKSEEGTFQIVSTDGAVAVLVTGEANALFLRNLLNTAQRLGVIARHLTVKAVA